jgi:hypothetical protein
VTLAERWRLRWLAWRLPRLLRRQTLLALLADLTPDRSGAQGAPNGSPAAIVAATQAILRRPWRMRGRRCLREGLLAYHALRRAGYPAALHFSVLRGSQRLERLRAHCWVTLDRAMLLNAPEGDYAELLVYDGRPVALQQGERAAPSLAAAGWRLC